MHRASIHGATRAPQFGQNEIPVAIGEPQLVQNRPVPAAEGGPAAPAAGGAGWAGGDGMYGGYAYPGGQPGYIAGGAFVTWPPSAMIRMTPTTSKGIPTQRNGKKRIPMMDKAVPRTSSNAPVVSSASRLPLPSASQIRA